MANEKFCGSCGAKMNADAGFCPVCGAKQAVVEAVAAAAPVVEAKAEETVNAVNEAIGEGGVTQAGMDPEKIKKYLPLAGVGAAVLALIIAIVAIIINLTKWTKIDPEELCRVTFEGLEGQAVPVVSFAYDEYTTFYLDEYADYDGIEPEEKAEIAYGLSMSDIEKVVKAEGATMADLNKYLKEEYKDLKTSEFLSIDEDDLVDAFEKAKDEDEALEMKEALLDCITFEVDFDEEKDKLKNGDKVKVTVDYDKDDLKDYNIKLTKESFEVKVSGLMKGEEIDIFEGLEVTFEGIDGDGDAVISTNNCSDFIKNNFGFYFETSSYNLSNGGTVTVKGYYDGSDYDRDYKGVVDEEKKVCYLFESDMAKDFTVSGLTELQEVEVFDYIDVTYEGIAPDLDINISWKDDTPDYIKDNVSVSTDTWGMEIVDGTTFVASAYAYGSFADNGYKLKTTEKTYTINFADLERYATLEDVTIDTYKDILDAQAQAKADEYVNKYTWDFDNLGEVKSIKSVTLKTTTYNVNKDQGDWWDDINRFAKIYEVQCTHEQDDSEVDGTFYVVAYLRNVTVTEGKLAEFTAEDVKYEVTDVYDNVVTDFLTENDTYIINEIK